MKYYIFLLFLFSLVMVSCGRNPSMTNHLSSLDGSHIDAKLYSFASIEECKNSFNNLLNDRIKHDCFKLYQITNEDTRYIFVQAYNYPREMPMFSIFAYQYAAPDYWVLRGYVPINDYFYSSTPGYKFAVQPLHFTNNAEFTYVEYRESTVFTISTNWYHVVPSKKD